MNGRGEVQKVLSKATMRPATRTVIGELLSHSHNDTAAVPWIGEPLAMAELVKGTKLSARTVRNELAEAQLYHWLVRYRSPRGTVLGQLQPGGDCTRKVDKPAKVCQWPPCGKKLDPSKRAHAQYHSDRCRQAANRDLKRIQANAEAARNRDSERLSMPVKVAQNRDTSQLNSVEAHPGPREDPNRSTGWALEKGETPYPEKTPLLAPRPPPGRRVSYLEGSPSRAPTASASRQTLDCESPRQDLGTCEGDGGKEDNPLTSDPPHGHLLDHDHAGFKAQVVQGGEESGRAKGGVAVKIAAERRQRLAGWYREQVDDGRTSGQIAAELGLTRKAVGGDLKALGITLRRSHVAVTDEFTQQRIRQLAAGGWPVPDIADETGASIQTIYKYARQVPEFAARVDDYKARVAASRRRRVTRLLAQLREEER